MTKILLAVLLLFIGMPGYSSGANDAAKAVLWAEGFNIKASFYGYGSSWNSESAFIRHLIGRGDYEESLFLLKGLDAETPQQRDSINYLTGWVYYRQKELDLSARYLLEVSDSSPAYRKSRFFAAYNLAHAGNTGRAGMVLEDVASGPENVYYGLRQLQLGGIALLERDYDNYHQHVAGFSGNHHVMAAEENRMQAHYLKLQENRPPSPFLAGVFSTVVPGLGKIYAGKTSEGIAGFLYVTALSLTAFDFYRGSGPGSLLFVLSASAAGAFYVGNIMGSVTAARRVNQEFNHEMDQRILFDMHIPLRNVF